MAQGVASQPDPTSGVRPDLPPETVIRPRRGWIAVNFRELWQFRDLVLQLAKREVVVRYKQTVIGALWAVIQPVMTMVVFTTLFKLLGRGMPVEEGTPYAVTTFTALLPWQLFAGSLARSSESLVANQSLITKVYFPRLVIPVAPTLSACVDFGVAFLVLIGIMLFYGIVPTAAVLALPLLVLLAVAASLSVSIWFSALTSLYRDFRFIVPFIVQLGMFISPVVYETASLNLEEKIGAWAWLYKLNPMVGVIEGFRWAMLGKAEPPWAAMAVSVVAVAVLLTVGMLFFRRMERTFADLV